MKFNLIVTLQNNNLSCIFKKSSKNRIAETVCQYTNRISSQQCDRGESPDPYLKHINGI